MKLTKVKLRLMIQEELNLYEASNQNADHFISEIEKIAKKYFSRYTLSAQFNNYHGDSMVSLKFAVGNKRDWYNGYWENSALKTTLFIRGWDTNKESKNALELDSVRKPVLITKPENSYDARGSIKVPYRNGKTSYDGMLRKLDKVFSDMRKTLKQNTDKLPDDLLWAKTTFK